jgi:hypothetical protein
MTTGRTHTWRARRRITRLAAVALPLLAAAVAAPASAAPGWAPPLDVGPANVTSATGDVGPAVAIDARGAVTAVWRRCPVAVETPVPCEVLAAERPPGGPWSAPVPIGAGATFPPVLAVSPGGAASAAWPVGAAEVRVVSRAAGGPWLPDVSFPAVQSGAGELEIAAGADGSMHLIWSESDLVQLGPFPSWSVRATRRAPGGAWEPAVLLPQLPAGGTVPRPQVAVDSAGGAVALWGSGGGLLSARRPAGGDWLPAETIDPVEPGYAGIQPPDLAVDAGGNAAAVWVSGGILRIARRPAAGTWAAPDAGPVLELAPTPGDRWTVRAGMPASGEAVAVYHYGTAGGNFGGSVAVVTQPAGGPIGAPTVLSARSGTHLGSGPRLAVDGAGGAIAAWLQRDGQLPGWSIRAAPRVAGAAWAPPDSISGPPTEFMLSPPEVAADASGRAVAVWFTASGKVQAALRDPVPPRLASLSIPATGFTAAPVSFAATALDDFSGLSGPPAWSFGDGATAVGGTVSHAYVAPGTYTVAVQATDLGGATTREERRIVVTTPPVVGAPPRAVTSPPRVLCPTRLQLRGVVTPRGLPTTARFLWGERALTRRTRTVAVEEGAGRLLVSADLRGLKPGGVYRVRLQATNAKGTVRGVQRILRMPRTRLGPWRTPRAVPRGYSLERIQTPAGVRYVGRAGACPSR